MRFLGKNGGTLLVLVLLAGGMVVCEEPIFPDAYEPNDTFEEAYPLSPGTIQATIEPADDEDYYSFNLSGQDSVEVSYNLTVPQVLMPEINFYTGTEEFLDRQRADEEGQSLAGTLTAPPGKLVVRVRSFNYQSSDSSYTLNISTSLRASGGF